MSQNCDRQNVWRSMIRDGLVATVLAVAFSWVIRSGFAPTAVEGAEHVAAHRARPELLAMPY